MFCVLAETVVCRLSVGCSTFHFIIIVETYVFHKMYEEVNNLHITEHSITIDLELCMFCFVVIK